MASLGEYWPEVTLPAVLFPTKGSRNTKSKGFSTQIQIDRNEFSELPKSTQCTDRPNQFSSILISVMTMFFFLFTITCERESNNCLRNFTVWKLLQIEKNAQLPQHCWPFFPRETNLKNNTSFMNGEREGRWCVCLFMFHFSKSKDSYFATR